MKRLHGVVESAADLVPFGHAGWGYRDRSQFLDRAAEYIADGLRHNQYIAYAGDRSRDKLRAELAEMPGLRHQLDTGAIDAVPSEEYYTYYDGTDVIDPDAAVAKYLAAAQRAVANGYTGFRALSDVTPVARTAEQRDSLARLEFLVDRQMAVLPFSALCAYDTAALGAAANEVICLHPFVSSGSAMFRLYAEPHLDADFALAGELDAASHGLFSTVLQRVWPLVPDTTVRIAAEELSFIGHQQLRLLEDCARADNREVVLSTNQPTICRLVELLRLTRVRVDPVSGR
jgi:anti-anti-sigma regulatory factor